MRKHCLPVLLFHAHWQINTRHNPRQHKRRASRAKLPYPLLWYVHRPFDLPFYTYKCIHLTGKAYGCSKQPDPHKQAACSSSALVQSSRLFRSYACICTRQHRARCIFRRLFLHMVFHFICDDTVSLISIPVRLRTCTCNRCACIAAVLPVFACAEQTRRKIPHCIKRALKQRRCQKLYKQQYP